MGVREIAERHWERLMSLDPITATMIGDERFDELFPDPGVAGVERARDLAEGTLGELAALDGGPAPADDRILRDIVEALCRNAIAVARHRLDHFAAVDHVHGPANLLSTIAAFQRCDTAERVARYVARLSGFPMYFARLEPVLDEAAALGRVVPRAVLERTRAQVAALLSTPAERAPALNPVPAADERGRAAVREVWESAVLPGYRRYLAALDRYAERGRDTLGLCHVPGGDAAYAALLAEATTLPLDPAQLHEQGLAELAATREELAAFAAGAGFRTPAELLAVDRPGGDWSAAGPDEVLRTARDYARRGWAAAAGWFTAAPPADCEVRAVDAYRQAHTPVAAYHLPTPDGSRPGVLFVNPRAAAARNWCTLAPVIYHEASPGHHFQVALEVQRARHPAVRTFGAMMVSRAFTEGWGLHSERLAADLGLYRHPAEHAAMLDAQLWRIARLVVDTGIHARGWTRAQAAEVLAQTGLGADEADVELDRYAAMPGQALAYRVGQRELERWRADFAARGRADKEFHDLVLGLGSVPLTSLRRELAAALSGPS